ncbi:hypothetical protein HZA42_02725 [Candidatus Peregrinibacteria bacterium]|nr:hypothetical protein [Candidatus Peregrinibacteria bacterium]
MELLTINEAASLSGKSIQTIRRMIKHKKVQVKRQKTPQGFNYLIIKETLLSYLSQASQTNTQEDVASQNLDREHRPINTNFEEVFKGELERFGTTIQKLIEQNAHDKENFFGLIKTFQDRVFTLENHIKMLEAPRRKWWQVFK